MEEQQDKDVEFQALRQELSADQNLIYHINLGSHHSSQLDSGGMSSQISDTDHNEQDISENDFEFQSEKPVVPNNVDSTNNKK